MPGLKLNEAADVKRRRSHLPIRQPSSAFAGFRFPPEVILLAVHWYLRNGLSYRDLEKLLAERGIEVDRATLLCWVPCFTSILAPPPCRFGMASPAAGSWTRPT